MWEYALDFQVRSFFDAFFDFFLLSATLRLILERCAVVPRLLVSGRKKTIIHLIHSTTARTHFCVFWASFRVQVKGPNDWLSTRLKEEKSCAYVM